MKVRQFITLIPTVDEKNAYIVATSRQYTKELAHLEIYTKLEQANVPFRNKAYTKELIVDDEGVIRLVDDHGEVLPLDTLKI